MSIIRHLLVVVLVLGGLCFMPGTARAAQSYDNCTGFITSLPATIGTQGTWCLNQNLATSVTSGNAITIATNNVTIDCNDFKIGGLAAGDASNAIGIYASGRHNVTVRHCNVRGFYEGILLAGGAGHLVEDNRLDNSLYVGIRLDATDNSLVRRNRIFDTGGATSSAAAVGIHAAADIIDNTVSGVFGAATATPLVGIVAAGNGTIIRGNLARGLAAEPGVIVVIGISMFGSDLIVDGNRMVDSGTVAGDWGISGDSTKFYICSNNTAVNFSIAYISCDVSINNLGAP